MALTITCEVLDSKKVRVTFSAPVLDDSDLEDTANYLITGGPFSVDVLAVEVQAISHPTYVDLTTSEQTTDANYDLEVVSATPAAASYQATVLADNPVLYYRLGESIGALTTANIGSAGSAHDGTFSTHSPVPILEAVGAIAGDPNTAVTFADTFGNVIAPFLPITSVSDFSIEAWTKQTAAGTVQVVLSLGGGDNLSLAFNGSTNFIWYHGGTSRNFVEMPVTPSMGVYHHLVLTREGPDLKLYVDSVVVGTDTFGTAINVTGADIYIANDAFAEHFVGSMDEVAFYDSALSAARVLAHYLAGAPV